MYVCICRGITENRIRNEIANGATTMKELGARLGVGTGCGQCGAHARTLLTETVHCMVRGGDGARGAKPRAPRYWEPAA